MTKRVIVVGAGITGLVAAREIARDPSVDVICLEASDHVGGQVHTIEVDGAQVDVGAEAVHLGAPHVAALVRELGLAESVVGAAPGSSVMATRKGLRPLPAGVGPTGPTRIWPVLKSGILSPLGLLRAGLEPLTALRKVDSDIAVGDFTRARFGREVTDTFVDPLLGNLHGGDVHRLSLRATAPQLVDDASAGRSMLLKNLKRSKPASGPQKAPLPAFASWPGGLAAFTRALAEQSRATIRTGARVVGLEHGGARWTVILDDGERLAADQVLFTTPGAVTADLLRPHSPATAQLYDRVPTASVATVLLGWDRAAAAKSRILCDFNGILLPSKRVRTFKAATNLTRKWPELGSTHHLLRASVGRVDSSLFDELDDDRMTTRVASEISSMTGIDAEPQVRLVYRWPHAMPQLMPGHKERVATAREQLAALGGIAIAGATVDGLGIGATVRSGQQAATLVADALGASTDSKESR